MEVVLIKLRSESQWTVLLGYLTITTDITCYYCAIYNNYVFQQNSAPVHLAFNTVQLLQWKTFNFLFPELWPITVQSCPLTVRCRELYNTV